MVTEPIEVNNIRGIFNSGSKISRTKKKGNLYLEKHEESKIEDENHSKKFNNSNQEENKKNNFSENEKKENDTDNEEKHNIDLVI